VSVKFSLHDQTADGTIVYEETHSTSTNGVGLFSLTFGAGVPTIGTFTSINWSNGYKFLQVQTDIGNGYVDNGTQQLMAVPYALYAGSSGSTQVSNPDIMRAGKGFTMVSQLSTSNFLIAEGINYCANLIESGYDDWRTPTYEECMDFLAFNGYDVSSTFSFFTLTQISSGSGASYLISKSASSNIFNVGSYIAGFNAVSIKCNCV
jgi:hypothetical protein